MEWTIRRLLGLEEHRQRLRAFWLCLCCVPPPSPALEMSSAGNDNNNNNNKPFLLDSSFSLSLSISNLNVFSFSFFDFPQIHIPTSHLHTSFCILFFKNEFLFSHTLTLSFTVKTLIHYILTFDFVVVAALFLASFFLIFFGIASCWRFPIHFN